MKKFIYYPFDSFIYYREMQGTGLNLQSTNMLEVKKVSDIVNQSENAGGLQGCNGRNKPCTDVGMKYGIFIGVFPDY